jgi:hypothetical protein
MCTPSFTPRVEHHLAEWRGEQRISPPGDNFTHRGQSSPVGDNFKPGVKVCPRDKVKNGPQAFDDQGCQIFLGTSYPNGYLSTIKNIPDGNKIYPTAIK